MAAAHPSAIAPAVFHVLFFLLESILFPKVKAVQKIFLGKKSEDQKAVEVAAPILYNMGFYNLMLAAVTIWGLVYDDAQLVLATLYVYVGAAVVLVSTDVKKLRGALVQGVPALVAIYFTQFAK
jgi:putative membrane protein